ncbi:MAG: Lrp/AsnC family transcriptional regulator [bacterium]|nr:Lrp/AsnC family transcriptional regulator [bacterium]
MASKETRRAILNYIEKNSKADLGDLAIMLGTDELTIANEIQDMEKEQIICGYHTLIDWDKAGSDMITALIEVRVTPQRDQGFDKIAERIYNFPEVTSVYLISGGYDLLITLEGWTLKDVSQFVSEKLAPIDAIMSTATYFILKKYKDHGTIMVPQKKTERMLVTP